MGLFEFGIVECGPGWESLYKPVIELARKYESVKIVAIRERGGFLNIVLEGDIPEELEKAKIEAEEKSQFVCEDCGWSKENAVHTNFIGRTGQQRTLCGKCKYLFYKFKREN